MMKLPAIFAKVFLKTAFAIIFWDNEYINDSKKQDQK